MFASYHTCMSVVHFFLFIHVFMHIGSPEGVTLLELETVGEEVPPVVQEGQKGKDRSRSCQSVRSTLSLAFSMASPRAY